MTRPLDRLARSGVPVLDADGVDAFVAGGPCILFFAGDPDRRPETSDLAVVVELLLAASRGLRVALVASAAEASLGPPFGVDVVPSLVAFDAGGAREVLARVQPWAAYARLAARLAPPGDA